MIKIDNKLEFEQALQDLTPAGYDLDHSYTESSSSLYVDTSSLLLYENQYSLALKPLSDRRTGAILKYPLKADKTRVEVAELIEDGLRFPEEISKILLSHINCDAEDLKPILIVKQKRTHKVINSIRPKLFFSFDEVEFTNLVNNNVYVSYFVEVEVTSYDCNELESGVLTVMRDYYISRYNGIDVHPTSKYIIGVSQAETEVITKIEPANPSVLIIGGEHGFTN